jgi:hypothetical protein
MNDPLVTVAHLRAAKLCSRGARDWCTRNGIDYTTFVTKGIPASAIESKHDGLGNRLARIARDEAALACGLKAKLMTGDK